MLWHKDVVNEFKKRNDPPNANESTGKKLQDNLLLLINLT